MKNKKTINVDDKVVLKEILEAIKEIQKKIKIVWPIHPRAKKQLKKFGLGKGIKNLVMISPLGYLEMLNLMQNADFVLTDSGGIQEETTVLGVSCLTLRDVTERPITVNLGTNIVVGTKKEKIIKEAKKISAGYSKKGQIPKYWDGETARRIIKIILSQEI